MSLLIKNKLQRQRHTHQKKERQPANRIMGISEKYHTFHNFYLFSLKNTMKQTPIVITCLYYITRLRLIKMYYNLILFDFSESPVKDVMIGAVVVICGLVVLFVRRCKSKLNM